MVAVIPVYFSLMSLLFVLLPAKDLIRGLLRTDPQNRFTVEQLLNNPWIKVGEPFTA